MNPTWQKARALRLMAFDVDGILTDGHLYFSPRGDELKAFSSRDGLGMRLLARAGIQIALITGRDSPIVARRAENLGITLVQQGVDNKLAAMTRLLDSLGLGFEQAGYMGDDLIDLAVMTACGFSATVADGHALVREQADYIAEAPAGSGAVREVCELILQAQGHWQSIVASYQRNGST